MSTPAKSVFTNKKLPNGDEIIYEFNDLITSSVPTAHILKIIKKADASQKFPYLVECSCGSQAREYTEQAAREAAALHIHRRSLMERPR